ncbi:DUF4173 domain-containing protein [Flavobacteriaceae bacterium TP-CH-4]|uniref:DUF4173 domain-containing protein n=1 Tax=Pelagihabitans pacificus TaxID=2696054 RepID=A0A967E534_9FLAO|nr:DUF4173 domain-containing protein [Pelagihabitans pacificus]NHF58140.1 DUF4173 domain-containing protein [Pelagihabitans pacificus]
MNIHIKCLLSAIAFSLLFYSKSLGLNLFLISILVVVLVTTVSKARPPAWEFASAYIITSFFVFLNPTGFTIFVHFMAFLVFVGKSISKESSLYISWLLGVINMMVASLAHLTIHHGDAPKESKKLSPILWNRIKGGFAALLLLLVFGLLYKNANPVFGNLLERINLDFISFPWLFFTVLGYVVFLHLLRPYEALQLIEFDRSQGNVLEKPTELVLIGSKKELQSENTLGGMVFFALNLLLVFFLITDIIYLLQENVLTNSDYSKSVHQGVYALLFSILCAIGLILYFFRGNLNFYGGNRRIKALTFLWIGLNVVLVAFTAYKNYAYVEALGLTYKRIGVFVYLLLTLTGLLTAYIKVAKVRNFTFLVRTNIATVFGFLIISAAIPWNQTITHYNLGSIGNPDLEYLIHLGSNNSTALHRFLQEHPETIPPDSRKAIEEKYRSFVNEQYEKTWQEYSLDNLVNADSR